MGACCGKASKEQSFETKQDSKPPEIAITIKASEAPIIKEEKEEGTLFAKVPFTSKETTNTEHGKNQDLFAERRRQNDMEIMKEFPIGFGWKGDKFQTTFWIPECQETMKHFIDVHNIPIYELGNADAFRDYCKERKWLHTMEKFWEMWESLQEINTRIIHAAIIRYDVYFDISDCFMSDRGDLSRAYKIFSYQKDSVLKAFSYITNTLRPNIGHSVRWHHDTLFSADIYPIDVRIHNKYYPLKADCCGQRWDRLEFSPLAISMTASNNNVHSFYSRCLDKKSFLEGNQSNNNNNQFDSEYFTKLLKKNISTKPLCHDNIIYEPKNVIFELDDATIIYFKSKLDINAIGKIKSLLIESLDFKIKLKESIIDCTEINDEISQIKMCLNNLIRLKYGNVHFTDDNLSQLELILVAIPDLIKIEDKLNQLICLHGCSGAIIKSRERCDETISYLAIRGFKENIKKLQNVMKNVLVLNYSLEEQDILL